MAVTPLARDKFKFAERSLFSAENDRLKQREAKERQPSLRDSIAIVNHVREQIVAAGQLAYPPLGPAQEMPIVFLDCIGSEQPRSANAVDDIDPTDPEHRRRHIIEQRRIDLV